MTLIRGKHGKPSGTEADGIGLSETARLEAFSDAVFAIAITILVLNIIESDVAEGREDLFRSLVANWPILISFMVGFVTIFVCWINHHFVFQHIKKTDTVLNWLNGFQLLVVTFAPFPAHILSIYIRLPDRNVAIGLFGVTYFLMAVSFDRLWSYAERKGYLSPASDTRFLHAVSWMYRIGVLWTVAAFVALLFDFWTSLVLYVLVFLHFGFPSAFSRTLMRYLR